MSAQSCNYFVLHNNVILHASQFCEKYSLISLTIIFGTLNIYAENSSKVPSFKTHLSREKFSLGYPKMMHKGFLLLL